MTGRLSFLAWIMQGQRRWAGLGLALALITALANILLLAVAGWFITGMALAGAAGVSFNYFLPAAAIRALAIVRAGGRYLERLVTHDATLRLIAQARSRLFLPLTRRPLRDLDTPDSDLAARLGSDLDALQRLFLQALAPVLVAALALPVLVGGAAHLDFGAALILALGLAAGGIALPALQGAAGRALGRHSVAARQRLRDAVTDAVAGREELWSFNALERQRDTLTTLARAVARTQSRLATRDALGGALLPGLATLCAWGVALVAAPTLPGPDLALLVFLALAGFDLVAGLPEAGHRLGATLATVDRLRSLADPSSAPPSRAPASCAPFPSGGTVPSVGGSGASGGDPPCLTLDAVGIAGTPPPLRAVSATLPPGARLGLVGPSGAGKSSVAAVLCGFTPWEGTVAIDGVPIDTPQALAERALVSLAPQTPRFLAGGLRDNLRLAAPTADDATLRHALEAACLTDWLASLPDGLDTLIGEGGRPLSGGEARRLCVARALLGHGPVLILDEPGEGLDPALEARVLDGVLAAAGRRTVILITHRPQGLDRMTGILCLDRGRAVAQGDPWTLARTPGPFRRFLERTAL